MICVYFLLLFFFPYYFNIYSNSISVNFYFGLSIRYELDTFELPIIYFDFRYFLSALLLIAATIMLILLLILCNKLKRGGLLGLGIPIAVIMIMDPIVLSIYDFFIPIPIISISSYYFYDLFASLIVLGVIMMVKEVKHPDVAINKDGSSNFVETKTILLTCNQCGTVIKTNSEFCMECGNKL